MFFCGSLGCIKKKWILVSNILSHSDSLGACTENTSVFSIQHDFCTCRAGYLPLNFPHINEIKSFDNVPSYPLKLISDRMDQILTV